MNRVMLAAVLLSTAAVQTGNGVVSVALPGALDARGLSYGVIGGITAAVNLGLLVGTALAPALMGRRDQGAVVAALVAGSAVAVLPQLPGEVWWLPRLLTGLALAVLFIALESAAADAGGPRRGAAVAGYMVVTYAALALGPWLQRLGADLNVGAGLLIACCAPAWLLGRRRAAHREPPSPPAARAWKSEPRRAAGDVPVALASGISTGALLALGPLYCLVARLPPATTSLFLSLPLVLALLAQAPLGWWLDHGDELVRRRTLRATTRAFGVSIGVLGLLAMSGGTAGLIAAVLVSGTTFCLYPLALAVAFDAAGVEGPVPAGARVLRWWGVGAVLGPLLTGALIELTGPSALFGIITCCGVGLSLVSTARKAGCSVNGSSSTGYDRLPGLCKVPIRPSAPGRARAPRRQRRPRPAP